MGSARRLWWRVAVGLVVLLAAMGLLVAVTPVARAHDGPVTRAVPVRAGAYRLVVSFYGDPPRVGTPLAISVDPAAGMSLPTGRLVVLASAVPASGVNASPIRVPVTTHEDQPRGVAGTVQFPAAGAWTLRLELLGPMGVARADVPLRVEPAATVPPWIAWTIGVVPLVGLLGFIGAQAWSTWRAGGFRDV